LLMDVVDGLISLLNKSMLQRFEDTQGELRFTMLETIREYAFERLAASGEAKLLRQCHTGYYLAMAERAAPELRAGPQQVMWLDRLEREYDNLRAALSWSLELGEAETALRLSVALWRFWYWHSHLSEGCRWMTAALAAARYLPQLAPVRVRALNGAGNLASALGDYAQAASLLEEGLALGRELGQTGRANVARMLNTLGTVTFNQANYQRAESLYKESLALQRELGDEVGIAHALNNLGTVVSYQGDYGQAETFLQESLARFRALGIKWGIAYALGNLGRTALCRRDCARANALIEESLALCRELGDRDGVAECKARLGGVAAAQGKLERAVALYQEALSLYQEVGDRPGIAECLRELASVAAAQADVAKAACLFGVAEALRDVIGASLLPDERANYDGLVAAVRARLGDKAFAAAWASGRTMMLEQAVAYALGKTDA
jgi:tetratricopeptide (TPR) repeat protein